MDEVTPAQVSAIEAKVETLAQLLGGTLAAMGALNAHVGVSFAHPGPEIQERMESINADITDLYEKLTAIWPEPE